ncbi:hypothetical protein SAMN05660649_02363 [Desulfotomaculum arcticum]|uniref:Uncharacterized protein n=1 Tax=Desulfotruncus arcticus DSM 17038 TaxID=1121424 RepID=A0A1I2TVK0_9FIRM|nr:hypothetical protein [Desulfotruncus arcticus]SFG68918.1 hypothetical protein SAMN05660649_02363 [Desulfotomaculum arcticum] [Desulfotruncus arcticus DSM 17038]
MVKADYFRTTTAEKLRSVKSGELRTLDAKEMREVKTADLENMYDAPED